MKHDCHISWHNTGNKYIAECWGFQFSSPDIRKALDGVMRKVRKCERDCIFTEKLPDGYSFVPKNTIIKAGDFVKVVEGSLKCWEPAIAVVGSKVGESFDFEEVIRKDKPKSKKQQRLFYVPENYVKDSLKFYFVKSNEKIRQNDLITFDCGKSWIISNDYIGEKVDEKIKFGCVIRKYGKKQLTSFDICVLGFSTWKKIKHLKYK